MLNLFKFNLKDHYWLLDDSTDRLWTSRRSQYVLAEDSEYQNWLSSKNGVPTKIISETKLCEVLNYNGLVGPKPEVPESISDRQFFQELALLGIITREEALEAVKIGTIPNTLQMFINNSQDPDFRFNAEMLLSGATVFHRDHPLTAQIGLVNNWTSSEVDQFFIDASKL